MGLSPAEVAEIRDEITERVRELTTELDADEPSSP
jgi:hypothetical protein